MIYVSSSSVKASTIKEAVMILVENGFHNIELSGGTNLYEGFISDLVRLKEEFSLNFLCHNYFPPPKTDFVLNLASLNKLTAKLSVDLVLKSIEVSEILNAKKYGFHAGFLVDIPVKEVGREVSKRALFDRFKAVEQFLKSCEIIEKNRKDIDLYIENNVISIHNYESYGENPFLLTSNEGIAELNLDSSNYKPLLDIGHLKVSCQTLGLGFKSQLSDFFSRTDYIHISDNDGRVDSNQAIWEDSEMYEQIKNLDWKGKTMTLEIYSGLDDLKYSYQLLKNLAL